MSKHIHIHVHSGTDDDQMHAPAGSSKGGQFVSGGGSGAKPASKHTPMKQANRNLQAQSLKEARKIVKRPQLTIHKGIAQEQAEADVAEAKQRIAAKANKPVGANAHKLINSGFAATMNSGQRALSGFPNK